MPDTQGRFSLADVDQAPAGPKTGTPGLGAFSLADVDAGQVTPATMPHTQAYHDQRAAALLADETADQTRRPRTLTVGPRYAVSGNFTPDELDAISRSAPAQQSAPTTPTPTPPPAPTQAVPDWVHYVPAVAMKEGVQQALQGASGLLKALPSPRGASASPSAPAPSTDDLLNSASDLMSGAMKVGTPLLASSFLAAPVRTLLVTSAAMLTAHGAEKTTEALGGSPAAQRFASVLAGAVGAGVIGSDEVARYGEGKLAEVAAATRAAGDRAVAAREAARTVTPDADVIDVQPVVRPAGLLEADNNPPIPSATEPASDTAIAESTHAIAEKPVTPQGQFSPAQVEAPVRPSPDLVPVGEEPAYNAQHPAAPPVQTPEPTSAIEAVMREARDNPDLVRQADAMKAQADAARDTPAAVEPADPGAFVKFQIPGLQGPRTVAGTVTRTMPDGQVEVRMQLGGYHVTAPENLIVVRPSVPATMEASDADESAATDRRVDSGPSAEGPLGDDSRQERRPADEGGTPARGGEGNRPARRGVRRAPDFTDLAFARRPLKANQRRLTPEVRRELVRMQDEMETFPFVARTWNEAEKKSGNAAGGDADIVAGAGGAPVFQDIVAESPLAAPRKRDGKLTVARSVSGGRGDVREAIRRVLASGDIHNHLAEGAVRVAEKRAAGDMKGLSKPWLQASWETRQAVPDTLDEEIDKQHAHGDGTYTQDDVDGDISFNPEELEASPAAAPAVDTLDTGEEQPRLPEAGTVRDQNVQTPEMEAPFALNAETDTTPKEREGDLFAGEKPTPKAPRKGRGDVTLQSTILPGAAEFMEMDLAPIARGLRQVAADVAHLVAPQSASPRAQRAADIVRQAKARAANRAAIEVLKYKDVIKRFDKRTDDQNIAAIAEYERTGAFPADVPKGYSDIYHESMAIARELLQEAYGYDKVGYVEHYVRRAFLFGTQADEDRGTQYLMTKRRTLAANQSPTKGRILDMPLDEALSDMRERGIKVKLQTTNPETLRQWSLANAHQAKAFADAWGELKEAGLVEFVPAQVPGTPALPVLHIKASGPSAGRAPEGWLPISERGASAFYPKEKGLGQYYADPHVARVLNNATSKGLGGSATYQGLRAINNAMNQLQLGLSAFHFTGSAINAGMVDLSTGIRQLARALVTGNAPLVANGVQGVGRSLVPLASFARDAYRGHQLLDGLKHDAPDAYRFLETRLNPAGGRLQTDARYRNQMAEKMRAAFKAHNYIGAGLRLPLVVVETVAKPLMEFGIPRVKLGVLLDRLEDIDARMPDASAVDKHRAYAAAADQIDNIFGLLVYDNGFWNKTAQDLSQIATRSVGWTGGSLRWGLGAAADVGRAARATVGGGKEPRARPGITDRVLDALTLPIYVGLIGAVTMIDLTKLKTGTGKLPQTARDFYYPQNGETDANGLPNRTSLPTYMKDVVAYGTDPISTLVHKQSPLIEESTALYTNRDYWNDLIADPRDPKAQQWLDRGQYVLRNTIPFGLTGGIGPFFGFTPEPRAVSQTAAEAKLHEIQLERGSGARTHEQVHQAEVKAQITRGLRARTPAGAAAATAAAQSGDLTKRQIVGAKTSARFTYLQNGFKALPLSDAIEVYEAATPQERRSLRPLFQSKAARLIPQAPPDDRGRLVTAFRHAITLPMATAATQGAR